MDSCIRGMRGEGSLSIGVRIRASLFEIFFSGWSVSVCMVWCKLCTKEYKKIEHGQVMCLVCVCVSSVRDKAQKHKILNENKRERQFTCFECT